MGTKINEGSQKRGGNSNSPKTSKPSVTPKPRPKNG